MPVIGKVLFDGEPVTAGSIYFQRHEDDDAQVNLASSLLQLDGSFTIRTYPYGDGVPPGTYKVTLSPELAGRIKRPELGVVTKTPWTVEVPESGLKDHLFEVN